MEAVFPQQFIQSKTVCRTIGVAAFMILMVVSAFVRIPVPLSPVPVTLQTLVVLLCGACLGSSLGVTAQLGYTSMGLAGLTVFSGAGSGLGYLCGPTGGYIAGFIAANALLGRLFRQRRANFYAIVGKFLAADAVVFICGMLWLKILFGYGLSTLFSIGVAPFIIGDLAKILIAAAIFSKIQPRVRQIF